MNIYGDLPIRTTPPEDWSCQYCKDRAGTTWVEDLWLCDGCSESRARTRWKEDAADRHERILYGEAINIARGLSDVTPTQEHVRILWDHIVWVDARIEQMKGMIANASGDLRKAIDAHLPRRSTEENETL